jgi:hypothetical protein
VQNNPFQVLGLPPTADASDAELAYRQLLRSWHPDLHQDRGVAAVREAEAITRRLNEAIGMIRAGWRPVEPRSSFEERWPDPRESWSDEGWGEAATDPVPCPFCGEQFTDPEQYRAHLDGGHQVRMAARHGVTTSGRITRWVGALRFIPAWLVLCVWVGSLFVTPVTWWGFSLAFLALVLWTQVSPRFRRQA